jgi:AcrR family transcriptional regulator
VPRLIDADARAQLLRAIVDYVLAHGIADLSLRPLAQAVGSSPRMLLYHFGSKEELIVAIVDETRRRHADLLSAWYERSAEHDARTLLLRAWQWLTAPRNDRLLRLLFETYGLALQDRKRYAVFLRSAVSDWIRPFAQTLERQGFTPERAAALATLLVGVIRGLLLDILATGDRRASIARFVRSSTQSNFRTIRRARALALEDAFQLIEQRHHRALVDIFEPTPEQAPFRIGERCFDPVDEPRPLCVRLQIEAMRAVEALVLETPHDAFLGHDVVEHRVNAAVPLFRFAGRERARASHEGLRRKRPDGVARRPHFREQLEYTSARAAEASLVKDV